MKPFVGSIEKITERSRAYRHAIHTGRYLQLVTMSLKPREAIGFEVHPRTDQFIRVEKGHAVATIAGKRYRLKSGDAIVIPAGTRHNVQNASKTSRLQLYTIYAPPHHPPGTLERNKPRH